MAWIPLLLAIIAGVLLQSCPPPAPSVSTHTVSGKLIDGSAGVPLAGGVVDFAGLSATSAADGSYSLDLGVSTGTVNGTVCVHAAGFAAYLVEGLTLDASVDSTATWMLQRTDSSGLTGHILKMHINELQTNASSPTEIPNGASITVAVLNKNGARGSWTDNYSTGGYGYYTTVGGDSCIVSAFVDLSGDPPLHSFNVIKKDVLVTAASQDLDLDEDLSSEKTMSITGDAAGNIATLYLVSPNGVFPATGAALDGSAQATIHLSNRYGYEGFWSQSDGQTTASSAVGPVASTGTLPAIPSLGPVSSPDPNTLAFSSGTLSVGVATGASGYGFWLMDGSNLVAIVSSAGASVTLPAWMQTVLAGKTVTVMVYATDSNVASVDMSSLALMMSNGGVAPSVQLMMAMGGTKDVVF